MATVIENEENDVLVINGLKFEGFIDDAVCEKCSERRIYSSRYDAYFCAQCNEWMEDACKDPSCEFCAYRPFKPLPWGSLHP
jgi:hypothetical protein